MTAAINLLAGLSQQAFIEGDPIINVHEKRPPGAMVLQDIHDPGHAITNSPPLGEDGIHRWSREKKILDVHSDNDCRLGH